MGVRQKGIPTDHGQNWVAKVARQYQLLEIGFFTSELEQRGFGQNS